MEGVLTLPTFFFFFFVAQGTPDNLLQRIGSYLTGSYFDEDRWDALCTLVLGPTYRVQSRCIGNVISDSFIQ